MVHSRTTKWVRDNSFTKIRTNSGMEWYPVDLIGRAKLFDISATNQNQGGKCLFSQGIFRLARKKTSFTEGTLPFGGAYW